MVNYVVELLKELINYMSASFDSRYFYFNKPFVIFMKETDKLEPYFALKVDNIDVLVEDNLEDNIIM